MCKFGNFQIWISWQVGPPFRLKLKWQTLYDYLRRPENTLNRFFCESHFPICVSQHCDVVNEVDCVVGEYVTEMFFHLTNETTSGFVFNTKQVPVWTKTRLKCFLDVASRRKVFVTSVLVGNEVRLAKKVAKWRICQICTFNKVLRS